MLYNLKFVGEFDKEYWSYNPPIKKFLKENIELLKENDVDMLYHYMNEGDADDVSSLTFVLLACDVDFLKYTNEIPKNCFYYCLITHFDIPQHIIYLGDNCFSETALEEIVIPGNVEVIGQGAFLKTDLKEITIPGNVKLIEDEAFYGCSNLQKVVIEEGVETISPGSFLNCPLDYLKFPSSISNISEHAFNRMGDIVVPKGSYAEQWCIQEGWEYKLEN